ncbi:hypothetical protein [Massilia timonae]|uniref:hypothetical protein n=1 Tax=Massilia timonae TaxID=47229 RepID=UPI0023535A7E|nr:hypothetical protein [Massilia timonae]
MNDETLDPYFSSATVGTYRPNTILTRMKSEADLNPEFGDVAPIALPAHVHEYIHHLHNYTTRTGVLQFYVTFLLYRLFVEGVNKDGEFSPEATSTETQNRLIDAGQLLVSIDGTCAHRPKKPPPRNEKLEWIFTVREKKNNSLMDIWTTAVTGSVSSTHNSEYFDFTVGHTFLTEGVAYCIDREIRRNQGIKDHMLDFGVPTYPYLAYRPLLNHLVGREVTVFEEISIGVAAMMGRSLISVCNHVKEIADTDNALPSIIRQAAQELNEKVNTRMLSLLKQTRSEFSEGDHLFSAVDQLITLINEGQKLRIAWPALERSFIEKQLDKDTYPNLVATLLDVCIMQEKPEQTGEFSWGGSGKIARDDAEATNLAVLQASIHFVRLHLRRNGNLASTTELQFERCPFSGACATEKELNNPEVCIKTPWRRFSEMRVNNVYCWYAAGISVLTSRRPA